MKRLAVRHHSVNRIQGKFTPVPEQLQRDIKSLAQQAFWTILFKNRDRETGICKMSNRQLASIIGKDERTVQRYTSALHRSPWLRKHTKRIDGKNRNEENTYTFPHLEESPGDKNVIEKNSDLNTNTTTPREARGQDGHGKEISLETSTADNSKCDDGGGERRFSGISDTDNGIAGLDRRPDRPVGNAEDTSGNQSGRDASGVYVSYHRLKWEHNRFLNHPPAMRELYDRNGALMAENRILRDGRKSSDMLHVAAVASTGRFDGTISWSEEDQLELEKLREWDRSRRA